MDALAHTCFAFGRFHLDPLSGRLTNGGTPIELRPKSLAVLHYLVAHPQRLIRKDELIAAVWGKVVVTEDSLVQCVREIRQALGDAEQRIVRTIPRGGYVFVADATEQAPAMPQRPDPPAPAVQPDALPPSAHGGVERLRNRWLALLTAGAMTLVAAFALLAMRFTPTDAGRSAADGCRWPTSAALPSRSTSRRG